MARKRWLHATEGRNSLATIRVPEDGRGAWLALPGGCLGVTLSLEPGTCDIEVYADGLKVADKLIVIVGTEPGISVVNRGVVTELSFV